MTSTTHRAAMRRAVRAGLAFGPVLQDRARLLRVALGICLATAFGLVLGDELVETLLCVGAFFGGVGSLIPHERHRFVVAWASAAMFTIAASVGAALHSAWPAVYVVLFAGMFASGLLRVVSVGLGVRLLFASIVMLIVAETVPAVATAGEAVGWLGLGAAISAACQFLPPYGPRHGTQRLAVSGLYDALALGAQEKAGGIDQRRSYAAPIRAAWRAVSLVPARRQAHVADLLGLLTEGERIAGELHALRTGEPVLGRRPSSCGSSRRRSARLSHRPDGRHRSTPGRSGSRSRWHGVWRQDHRSSPHAPSTRASSSTSVPRSPERSRAFGRSSAGRVPRSGTRCGWRSPRLLPSGWAGPPGTGAGSASPGTASGCA